MSSSSHSQEGHESHEVIAESTQIGKPRGVKANSPPEPKSSAGYLGDLRRSRTPPEKSLPVGSSQASRPKDRVCVEPGENQEVRMVNACTPDGSPDESHIKALVCPPDVLNGTPAPAGNSRDLSLEFGPLHSSNPKAELNSRQFLFGTPLNSVGPTVGTSVNSVGSTVGTSVNSDGPMTVGFDSGGIDVGSEGGMVDLRSVTDNSSDHMSLLDALFQAPEASSSIDKSLVDAPMQRGTPPPGARGGGGL